MKKIIFSIVIMLFFTAQCSAQYYIYHGNQKFEATSTFVFKCDACQWLGLSADGLEVTLAKNGNKGGYLMLAMNSPYEERFQGVITLILDDGTFIKCTDKGMRDYLNKQTISLYNLTLEEINKLRNIDIQTIRFTFKDPRAVSPFIGSYTADAEPPSYSKLLVTFFETSKEINNLFKK